MDIRGLLTVDQVLALFTDETGKIIAAKTFRSYVARGRAPAPAEHIGRTPLWKRNDILAWIRDRPGTAGRPRTPSRRTHASRHHQDDQDA